MALFNSTLPGEVEPPPPDDDESASRCHLLGTTGLIVQFIMGIMVLLSLLVKRQLERRKRPWRVWVWDVSKQLAGQAVVHGLNILISNVVADAADNNPCSLYFLNVLIDTTVGVLIFYLTLKALTWYLTVVLGKEGFISGQYGRPMNPVFWWRQLVPYLMSMVFMKFLVVLPLTLPHISTGLLRFGHATLEYLSPRIQIIFVMAIFPVIMNIIQFCIFDQIIKAGKGDLKDGDADDEDKEDEDDDGEGYRRVPTQDIESTPRTRRQRPPGARRRGSSAHTSRASTPVPKSPLLEPSSLGSKKDYGSTSPSPNLTPRLSVDGGSSRNTPGPGGTFWRNMLAASAGTEGSASATATTAYATPRSFSASSPQDSHSRLGASSTTTATTTALGTRDDWRSGAPSPESFRSTMDSHQEGLGQIPHIDLSPQSDNDTSLPPIITSSAQFGHVSRLSEDQGRAARKQLSPSSSTMTSVDDGMGMRDLP